MAVHKGIPGLQDPGCSPAGGKYLDRVLRVTSLQSSSSVTIGYGGTNLRDHIPSASAPCVQNSNHPVPPKNDTSSKNSGFHPCALSKYWPTVFDGPQITTAPDSPRATIWIACSHTPFLPRMTIQLQPALRPSFSARSSRRPALRREASSG